MPLRFACVRAPAELAQHVTLHFCGTAASLTAALLFPPHALVSSVRRQKTYPSNVSMMRRASAHPVSREMGRTLPEHGTAGNNRNFLCGENKVANYDDDNDSNNTLIFHSKDTL